MAIPFPLPPRQVCLDALDRQRPGAVGRAERVRAAMALLVALLELPRPHRDTGHAVWSVVGSGPGAALVLAAWSSALAA